MWKLYITLTILVGLKDVSSQGPPGPPCGPPPVDKPMECCSIPPLFTEEELAACGIEKPSSEAPKGPPDCSKQMCMLKNLNLLSGESVNKEAVAGYLRKYTEANPAYKEAIEKAIDTCLKDNLPGPPHICESEKIISCTFFVTFSNCPTWVQSEKCDKLKDHMEQCKAKHSPN